MITWQSVIFNALWIIGLSGVLATVSYTDWLRKTRGQPWKLALRLPGFTMPFSFSMFITALGIALSGWFGMTRQPIWQAALWLFLAISFLIQSIVYAMAGRKHGWDVPSPE